MSLNPFPVSAHTLHRRTVVHGDDVIRNVSFFPFFDRQGRVKRVLTIASGSAEIGALPRHVVIPGLSNLGHIRIPHDVPLFYPVRKSDLNELCSLWHFDPWWMLDDNCFLAHWARLPLKDTNCVAHTRLKLVSLFYRSDLSAGTMMVYRHPTRIISIGPWQPDFFPAKPPPVKPISSASHSPRWVLDPIWTRQG
jgi:hypothetical protein